MNITLSGSLGNISKPLAIELVQKGHDVTVISHSPDRQKDIEAIGAKAAIGSMEDVAFLTSAFTGADIVYVMETLGRAAFMDPNVDMIAAVSKIGDNYRQAIPLSGVKRVVHLSSVGAHTDKGNGPLAAHFNVESILNQLPKEVSIKFMRPVGFYYTILAFIPTIKAQNAIISNYGGDEKKPWVSPLDIAAVIAEEMEKPFNGRTIRYITSDEASPNELAKILGDAIGKPDLKWLVISDEQMLNGMISSGMNPKLAKGFVELNASVRDGVIVYDDYNLNKPELGKVKLKDYAKEFAAVYNQNA